MLPSKLENFRQHCKFTNFSNESNFKLDPCTIYRGILKKLNNLQAFNTCINKPEKFKQYRFVN